MKHNGQISRLLNTHCHNEAEYTDYVVSPILDYLGVPKNPDVRCREFPIRTFLGEQRTDYLILVSDTPILAIEAKTLSRDSELAKEQVKFFATNFMPDRRKQVTEQTVPFVAVFAGEKAQMFRIIVRQDGLTLDLEPIDGYLEWSELQVQTQTFVQAPRGQLPLAVGAQSLAPDVTRSEQLYDFYDNLFRVVKKLGNFPNDDAAIMAFNQIMTSAVLGYDVHEVVSKFFTRVRDVSAVKSVLNWFDLTREAGSIAANTYRRFVGRNFMGRSEGMDIRVKEGDRWRPKNFGRYLTPNEVINFMVNLVKPELSDSVIDFACGSAGFLGQVMSYVGVDQKDFDDFVSKRLIGCDIDPFSVSTARTFLTLLDPKHHEQFKVFQHNGLFSSAYLRGRYKEQDLSNTIQDQRFDVVISNPPGNKSYSGTNMNFIKKMCGLENKIWDFVLFARRALALAKAEGGRICLILPNGFFANETFQSLRDEMLEQCQLNCIITLPRLFDNNALMSIVYLTKTKKKRRKRKVFFASLSGEIRNHEGARQRINITSEFNQILSSLNE